MSIPKTIKQRQQDLFREVFAMLGIKTWRITMTRNELAMVVWMACHRVKPEAPQKEFEAIVEAVARIRRGQRKELREAAA